MLFSLCECWQCDINTLVRRYQLHDHQSQLLNSRAPSHSLLSRIEWILWARFIVTSHLSSDLAWNSRQNVSTPLIHILFIHITKIRHWFPWRKSKLVLIAYVLGHCGGPRPFLWQTEGCCHTVGVKKCVNSHLNQILLSAFSPAASLLSISVKERCHCKTAMQYRWICEFLWCDFVIKLQKMSNVIFYSSIHFLQMSVHFQTPKMIGPIYRTISVICWSIGFNNSWYMFVFGMPSPNADKSFFKNPTFWISIYGCISERVPTSCFCPDCLQILDVPCLSHSHALLDLLIGCWNFKSYHYLPTFFPCVYNLVKAFRTTAS